MRRKTWLAALALMAFAAPAAGQATATGSGAALDDPEANVVEEFVVVARDRGPAWWRVSDDDTTVYILALPETGLPPDLVWDQAGLNRRLRGANALVGGGRNYRMSLSFKTLGLLLSLRRSLRQKGEMEDDLAEPLRSRFVAAREAAGKDARAYRGWGPLAAGFLLLNDSRDDGPRWRDAQGDVRKAARKLKVRERTGEKRDAAPALREFKAGLTLEIQTACLSAALDDIEAGRAPAAEAARGWARGDVGAALKGPRGFQKCFLAVTGGPEIWRQQINDEAKGIAAELERPGKAVAIVWLRQLIAEGGVIETLEAQGLDVEGPAAR
ncbi:TraB/GumN family protein [uncultured Phenylobacterium sp.]|uniref:TraB/GumN family protein n=1 Tax=uncultured Phenylobacterium sp. TaxID=349273 RepID=UPI0025CD86BA|nr:TraB/GumN family protein [uncultured Phenylobacterium sp.]